MNKAIAIKEDHPEVLKYLNKKGEYDPNKSEKVRDAYKEDRVLTHRRFNLSASKLFDIIFQKHK